MNENTSQPDEPTRYIIRMSERAYRDIDEITVEYAELYSLERANQWREEIENAVASLTVFPRRCALVPEKFRDEVRHLVYRRSSSRIAHRILFQIVNEEPASQDVPTIRIMHVRHSAARPLTRIQIREIEAGD